jgi:RNA polymerase sigma-70 factor, ECF subfamily
MHVIRTDEQDQLLLSSFRNGDLAAFCTLVTQYQKPIFNAAYRLLGDVEQASDVAQTVFLRVFERIEDYDSKYKFFSWIYRIAVNEAIDFLRKQAKYDPIDDENDFAAPQTANPEWLHERNEVSALIQRALLKLTVDQRIVITLRHFDELSYREIAEILVLQEKTVKSRLFDARKSLAVLLGELKGVAT